MFGLRGGSWRPRRADQPPTAQSRRHQGEMRLRSSDMRRRLFGIVVIIVVLALLAVTGFMQLAKVARFHELNALHLQAAHALSFQLDAADGPANGRGSCRE